MSYQGAPPAGSLEGTRVNSAELRLASAGEASCIPPATASPLLDVLRRHPAWCLFALAVVARLGLLCLFASSPHFGVQSGDMRFYHDWALRIRAGQWTDHHAFYGLPGYAYLLAGVYTVPGVHPGVMLVLQALVDACTAVLVFRIAHAVLPPCPRAPWQPLACALLAGLGWVFFIPAQTFAAVLMPTVLAAACYWFCVDQALRRRGRPVRWSWLGLGLLLGGVAMMVATVLFALPLLMLAACRAPANRTQRATALLLLITGVLLGSAPASLHNHLLAHEPVFLSAHGGINFWIGNAPGANGYPKIPAGLRAGQQELLADSITLAEQESGRPLTRAEVSQHWSAKAWSYIRQHPGSWLRLLALKVKNFWNSFSYDDVTIIALLREEGVLWPGWGFGVVAVLGLTGLALGLARRPLHLPAGSASPGWVIAAVLLHMCALLPVFITERYRLAVIPGLLVLGAYALSTALDFARARSWSALARTGLLLLAAAAFVYQPAPRELLASMEPYNLAISELEAGQLDRAEQHLAQVAALSPGSPAVLFAQGNLWLKRGDPARAKGFYRQSLELEPRNADAFANLGVIASGEQRWELACRLFQAALALQPDDLQTRELLAQARARR